MLKETTLPEMPDDSISLFIMKMMSQLKSLATASTSEKFLYIRYFFNRF